MREKLLFGKVPKPADAAVAIVVQGRKLSLAVPR